MPKLGKRYQAATQQYDRSTNYEPKQAVDLVKNMASAKFDETVEVAYRLGIDPRQADQQVRGTVSLPHGTGRETRIAVIAPADLLSEAEEAGAEVVGGKELATEIAGGRALDFDVLIATPDLMPEVGKLGKILGPRGLMPNPKAGTVSRDVGKTVAAFKAGQLEYRNDRYGNVHVPIGKVTFSSEQLLDNLLALSSEVIRARPASAKGTFVRSVSVSSTMGPGIWIESQELEDQAAKAA